MPDRLSRTDRRLLLIATGVFTLFTAVALAATWAEGDTSENPSSYSAGSVGTKAAYLLLQASGYEVARWEQPPNALTDPSRTTLILAEPLVTPSPHEIEALATFLRQGGRIVATGPSGARLLSGRAESDPVGSVIPWQSVPAVGVSPITRAAPAIVLPLVASWIGTRALPLYAAKGAVVVVRLRVGSGDAFWWASATPMTNAGLREPGNLEFLLASVGAAGRRVLFDEYFHGIRPTLAGALLHSQARWVIVQLAICALALALTYSRRSGPVIPAVSETRLSPLEFTRTLGSLYQRAGEAAVPVDIAYRRARFRLTHELGLAHDADLDALERALEARGYPDAAAFAATLRACRDAPEAPSLTDRTALSLVRSLATHLEHLGLDKERA